jgi:prolipoprotein diacylglyceryltransferase
MSIQTFHNLIYLPALILAIVVGLKTRYKYKVSKPRCLVYLVVSLFYAFLMAELSGKVYNAIIWSVKHVETYQNRAIFGAILLTPLCIIATVQLEKTARKLFSRVLKSKQSDEKLADAAAGSPAYTVSVRNIMDMVTPIFLIVLIFVNIRCAWVGCCYGIPCSWGIHSRYAGTTVLPVQFFEAGCSLLIIIVCYFLKQKPFYRRGMAFPLAVSFYSAARFILEFLRYYSPAERNFFLHLTLWQWLCMFVLVSSAISVFVLYNHQPSEPLPGLLRPMIEKREAIKAERQKEKAPRKKQSVSQKKYSKGWQSTKKKYKKKK